MTCVVRGCVHELTFVRIPHRTWSVPTSVECFTNAILFFNQTLKATIPTLSVALNVFVATVIAAGLCRTGKKDARRVSLAWRLGVNVVPCVRREEVQAAPYTSILSVPVRAIVGLYAAWSLVFIILYAVNSPSKNVLPTRLASVQTIPAKAR